MRPLFEASSTLTREHWRDTGGAARYNGARRPEWASLLSSSRTMPTARKRTSAAVKAAAAPPKRGPPDLRIAQPNDAAKSKAAFAHLRPTADPEVFVNEAGSLVDKFGVLLSLGPANAKAEEELAVQLLGGPVDTPAKLLKLVALDVTKPLAMRIDAAKAAAPYFDKKTPVQIENNNQDFTLDAAAIAKLPRAQRRELLSTLRTMGVDLGQAAATFKDDAAKG